MAHSNNSVITGKLRGSLGKELVFREWEGKTIVAKAPKAREKPPTEKQAVIQEKFLLATKYANAVKAGSDEGLKSAYIAAQRPRQNLYSRALEDFLTSPVVRLIGSTKYTGAPGSSILVRAVDDFRVAGVQVQIYAAGGALLEKGEAVQQVNGVDWSYTATLANATLTGTMIRAIATDVPGNEGILEVTL